MQNMDRKDKQIVFYELIQGKHGFDLKGKLDEVFRLFSNRKYQQIKELTLDDVRYYISAIKKDNIGGVVNYGEDTLEHYCYTINIAKVDSNQQVKYGDLSKVISDRAEIVDLSDENIDMSQIGPLVDSQFLIDPFYSIVAMGRTSGGINLWSLNKFFQQIFDAKGLRFAAIPSEKGLADLNSMSIITAIDYKVAKTVNSEKNKDEARSELKDIALANELEADEFEMRMKSASLNKAKTTGKVRQIFSIINGKDEFDDVKSIKIEGIKDGHEVLFDLIKNKLSYRGHIEFDSAVGITVENNFDYLFLAFAANVEFITTHFPVKEYENGNEGKAS